VAIAPVGYAGRRQAAGLATVAVGFDGGAESELALKAATELAKAAGAELRIVAVVRPESVVYGNGVGIGIARDFEEAIREGLQEQVDRALAEVGDEVKAEGGVIRGAPEQELGSLDADVVVVGSRRYGPLRTVLLGGVSLPLSRSSARPVLVVPRGARVTEPEGALAG
jgi:nucleotide-binding universal stress UspA family protein